MDLANPFSVVAAGADIEQKKTESKQPERKPAPRPTTIMETPPANDVAGGNAFDLANQVFESGDGAASGTAAPVPLLNRSSMPEGQEPSGGPSALETAGPPVSGFFPMIGTSNPFIVNGESDVAGVEGVSGATGVSAMESPDEETPIEEIDDETGGGSTLSREELYAVEAQRIIDSEGLPPDMPRNKALGIVNARAKFNIEAANGNIDLDILGYVSYDAQGNLVEDPWAADAPESWTVNFMRHRDRFESPEQRSELDERVVDVMQRVAVFSSDATVDDLKSNPVFDIDGVADWSTRAMIASSFVSLTRNRPDLLENVINGRTKYWGGLVSTNSDLMVFVSNNPEIDEHTGYASTGNHMVLHAQSLWSSQFERSNGLDTPAHELVHLIDRSQHYGAMNGMLPNLSSAEVRQFENERNRLFQLYERNPAALGILRDYSFTNNKEFLADTVTSFLEQPEAFNTTTPSLYQFYARYFRIDPLELLPPANPNPRPRPPAPPPGGGTPLDELLLF